MKFYTVVDTNVLVSAFLKPLSNPGTIYKFIDDGTIIPLINNEIIDEYREVLLRPKFKLSKEVVDKIIMTITKNAILINEEHIDIDLPDPNDRVFYEVVMTSNKERNSRLVTGNLKHFPNESIIVTPKELCEIITNEISDS